MKLAISSRLVIGKLPHAAFRRLEQPGDEQIVMLAVEGVDEELGAAVLIQNVALVHEREAWPEAGGVDDEIDVLARCHRRNARVLPSSRSMPGLVTMRPCTM